MHAVGAIPAKPGMIAGEDHGAGTTVTDSGTAIVMIGVEAAAMTATVTPGNRAIPTVDATVGTGVRRGIGVVTSRMVATSAATRVDSITGATETTTAGTGAIGMIATRVIYANLADPRIAVAKAATTVKTGVEDAVANGVITAEARTSDSGAGAIIVSMSAPSAKIVVVPMNMRHVKIATTGAATSMMTSRVLIGTNAGVMTIGAMIDTVMIAVAITMAVRTGGAKSAVDIARTISGGAMTGAAAAA
ncbi:hypothetical protein U4A90_04205 [Actinotignum schaalii]|nr:hypothetical protein [Actinotignum schaalii]WQN45892.1 hypothetical protein U4A90_04205 [Actinotignum schaalii]